jgi:tetratricopeptide (TPR) repeat protein
MKLFSKIYCTITFLITFVGFSQQKDPILPQANQEFEAKKYADAEANYRISDSKSTKYAVPSYNLGNSIYKQNQSGESKFAYLKAVQNAKTREEKHKSFHNLGNVFMNEKNYQSAVEAYKNALRNNPSDEKTRYNYALAKKMLKDNPPKNEEDKEDKKKDPKKDKKDDKKDQDKDKKDQDKKDQDKKDGDEDKDKENGNQDKKDQPNKPKPGAISPERLESLMEAVNNEEKKVQDKINANKVQGKPVQTEKDW